MLFFFLSILFGFFYYWFFILLNILKEVTRKEVTKTEFY